MKLVERSQERQTREKQLNENRYKLQLLNGLALTSPLKRKNEYLVLVLGEETAVQAVVGSIVWAFRRLKKPWCREMSARGYALYSVYSQLYFFSVLCVKDNDVCHRVIMKWGRDNDISDLGNCRATDMADVKFVDLNLKLNEPYLYTHQGDCEHVFTFTDMRYDPSVNKLPIPQSQLSIIRHHWDQTNVGV